MSVKDFGRFMHDEPGAAGQLLESAADILKATGNRLARKADDVQAMARTRAARRRSLRLRRQAQQRLELAAAAYQHAQDLYYRAEGKAHLCSADPLRTPLS